MFWGRSASECLFPSSPPTTPRWDSQGGNSHHLSDVCQIIFWFVCCCWQSVQFFSPQEQKCCVCQHQHRSCLCLVHEANRPGLSLLYGKRLWKNVVGVPKSFFSLLCNILRPRIFCSRTPISPTLSFSRTFSTTCGQERVYDWIALVHSEQTSVLARTAKLLEPNVEQIHFTVPLSSKTARSIHSRLTKE